ncbi:regulator RcnB of Ni and Co efflux [Sphingomonas laterariae]|uniref:Regulator RcnB of Ni and Co efflux n=1 Tax=Edaphosphingomonas laterariae TaxID=861865 RepID=A0A239K5G0_9SPHN|nr:RcnB family protein [Sphingomonas laterariae]SNT12873.1 regulator RcnB of Ni and Co efflux [Sphingomonas laterariae]
MMGRTLAALLLAATAIAPAAAQSPPDRGSDRMTAGSRDGAMTGQRSGTRVRDQRAQPPRGEVRARSGMEAGRQWDNRPARPDPRGPDRNRGGQNGDGRWNDRDDRGRDWQQNDARADDRRNNDGRRNDWRWNDGRSNGRADNRPGNDHRWDNDHRDKDRRDNDRWDDDRRDDRRWSNNGDWDRRWRNDGRYDWERYRFSNRQLYRVPRYYPPRGHGYDYRRWSYGYRLPPYYYGQSYWISDPWHYRLPPAYGAYRWVRYYDDVLLIDITNGIVRDIIYSFFWR